MEQKNEKVHPLLVRELANTLDRIFHQNSHADKAIEFIFKQNRKWGSRDRRFFAEGVYEVIRYRRKYARMAGVTEPATYQDMFKLWAAYWIERGNTLPNMPEFKGLHIDIDVSLSRAEGESIPDWLDELGSSQFDVQWDARLHALNQPAQVIIRVNGLKTSKDVLLMRLKAEGIEVEPVGSEYPDALVLTKRANVFASEAFREGLFEVQDAGSQGIAPFLRVEPGMRVIDACAGAGGKSLHLASLMKNKGQILALDIHDWKLQELTKRARRNSVSIIETRVIESTKTIKRLEESADRLLLDVPCSGLGVLRRNPDKKWKLSPDEITRLTQLQSEILQSYSRMVKPGGLMVYATCSILPDENERRVQEFMAQDSRDQKWKILSERNWYPDVDHFDGFYACLFQKLS
jgi:16S rRNA (cytosine967-C5)-methyltransferase